MGKVLRASRDEDGHPVALKLSTASAGAMAIQQEIRTLTRLAHPGLVRVLDCGVQAGSPWYAMDFVEGIPLALLIPDADGPTEDTWAVDGSDPSATFTEGEGPQSAGPHGTSPFDPVHAARILDVVAGLCDALAYLHGEGVVHRDLKPDNVIVTPDGRPILVDFGLATEVSRQDGREAVQEGRVHGVAGTLAYMSPEQLRGARCDARTDLYALGCLICELLTGDVPFHAAGRAGMLQAKSAGPPPLPELPEAIAALIASLLQPEPSARPGFASEVGRQLRRLGGRSAFAAHPTPPRPYLYEPRLAGRSALLAEIERATTLTCMGRGTSLALAGPSGTGRSRLLRAIGQQVAGAGVVAIASTCTVGMEGPPLQAFLPMFEALAAQVGAGQSATPDPILGSFSPALASVLDRVATPRSPEETTEAVVAAVYALTEERPLALLIDDAHAADELSARVIARLAAQPLGPVLVVLAVDGGRAVPDGARTLPLGALEAPDIAALVGDMLGTQSPPVALTEVILERSQGSPLVAVSTLYGALSAGWLDRDDDAHWTFADAIADLPRTGAGLELAARRLQALDGRAREYVLAASILGRRVPRALLAAVAEVDPAELDAVAAVWASAGVLIPDGEAVLRFDHEAVREAARARLEPARAKALHHRAAIALDTASDLEAEQAGHHWHEAGELLHAQSAFLRAGVYAAVAQGREAAERLLERCIALAPETSDAAIARSNLAFDVLRAVGRMSEAVDHAQEALALADRLGDPTAQVHAGSALALLLSETGRAAEALALARVAVEHSRTTEDRDLRVRALAALGPICWSNGDMRGALAACVEGAALAPKGHRYAPALRLNTALLQGMFGAYADARAALRQMLDEGGMSRPIEATLLNALGGLSLNSGHFDEALAYAESTRAVAAQAGFKRMAAVSWRVTLLASLFLEDFEAAEEALAAARSAAEALGDPALAMSLGSDEARLALTRSELDRAERIAHTLLDEATERGSAVEQRDAEVYLARVARIRGQPERAHEHALRAVALTEGLHDPVGDLLCTCEAGLSAVDPEPWLARAELRYAELQVVDASEASTQIRALRMRA